MEYKVVRILGMEPKRLQTVLNMNADDGWMLYFTDGSLVIFHRIKKESAHAKS